MAWMFIVLFVLMLFRGIWLIVPLGIRNLLTVVFDVYIFYISIRAIKNLKYSQSGSVGKLIKFLILFIIACMFGADIIIWAIHAFG